MKFFKSKKRVKGMTLIEVLIAIAVLGVAGLLMCKISQTTSAFMTDANHVNNKVAVEAGTAATRDISETDVAADHTAVEITVGDYGKVKAQRYSTKSLSDKATAGGRNCDTNMDADLQFYVIETETATS